MPETEFRIFRGYQRGPRLRAPRVDEPSNVKPRTSQAATAPPPQPDVSGSPHEERMVAIVEARMEAGSVDAGYRVKEELLRDLFCSLTRADASGLLAKLSTPGAHDKTAAAFTRLSTERRGRLLGVLRDIARLGGR